MKIKNVYEAQGLFSYSNPGGVETDRRILKGTGSLKRPFLVTFLGRAKKVTARPA